MAGDPADRPHLPADPQRTVRHPRSTPRGYPHELERDVVLGDGRTVHVRPVVPQDLPALRAALQAAEPSLVHSRFLGAAPPDRLIARRVRAMDYRRDLALVVLDPAQRLVGEVEYAGSTPGEADLAIALAPDWQGAGLGTSLVRLLALAARERGVRRLTAVFAPGNTAVARLLDGVGVPVARGRADGLGVIELDLLAVPVPPPPPAQP
ncbi:MAG TPA: GNAT family N-acetyltransferase [Motilibacteraceae bacterium]|nr:GNAT family N-acetyltransferase [Motilibacteraceae bacterium]